MQALGVGMFLKGFERYCLITEVKRIRLVLGG
jgi:hypothetical protein